MEINNEDKNKISFKSNREILATTGLIDVNEIIMENYLNRFFHTLIILFLFF
jgi:hypothetical protein